MKTFFKSLFYLLGMILALNFIYVILDILIVWFNPEYLTFLSSLSGLSFLMVLAIVFRKIKIANWKTYPIKYQYLIPIILAFLIGYNVLKYCIDYYLWNKSNLDYYGDFDAKYIMIYLFSSVIIYPCIEELIFRKFLIGYMISGGFGKIRSILTSSLFFGLYHISISQYYGFDNVLFSTIFGVFIGMVYVLHRNFFLVFLIHSISNLMVFIMARLNVAWNGNLSVFIISILVLFLSSYLIYIYHNRFIKEVN